MEYDAIVIGGGLSGLTAASLLAKRGIKVAVIEQSSQPGGSCGIFKRNHVIFDQGAAMLYGFGEAGFNAHRFVFSCLEEPIDMIRHDLLYCVNYNGKRIAFWPDVDRFSRELAVLFPAEESNIRRFYRDMLKMYQHVLVENPVYTTADETDPRSALKSVLKHPVSYLRFLSYLNQSAKSLLEKYFTDPDIFHFFDKLTSTYCYATLEEAPAVLAAVMFVDNHVGGSYYPAGSTLFLPGILEKVIEENGGDLYFGTEVLSILFRNGKPYSIKMSDGHEISAADIIYSGTVWNLYGKLIDPIYSTPQRRNWAMQQVPTCPSVVLYCVVDRKVIPDETAPIEMLVSNPEELDENEVTAYILSIDDRTLCAEDEHTIIAIGPTFENWYDLETEKYQHKKKAEEERLIHVLEKRFPGIGNAIRYKELATPRTIERYTLKNGGAVAGPKQMLGQHMFHRLHTRTEWDNLFCCGESTVMGTGTPTVTTSGLTAANVLLKKLKREPYVYRTGMKNFVKIVDKPFTRDRMNSRFSEPERKVMNLASCCRYCEVPSCNQGCQTDIPGIMRRVTVGNFIGAKRSWQKFSSERDLLESFESRCVRARDKQGSVRIRDVVAFLEGSQP